MSIFANEVDLRSLNYFHGVKTPSKGTKHTTVYDFGINVQHFIGFWL